MPEQLAVRLPTHEVGALTWGPVDGRLVLALHGFPDTPWTWRRVAPLLAARGCWVVAPAMRGYAPSEIPDDGDYSVPALAQDAIALHAALGGRDDAVLLGHDWGAIAANAVAAREAQPFGHVVAVSVPPFAFMNPTRAMLRPWMRAIARQSLRSWYVGFNQLPRLPERWFERFVAKLWGDWSPGYDPTEDLAHLAEAVPDRAHAHAVISYYRALLRLRDRSVMAPPRGSYRYLHGADDGCLDPRLFPLVQHHLGDRAVLVPEAGHFVALERPDCVVSAVLETGA